MAQQTFSGAGPGDPADLDANFTELYALRNLFTVASGKAGVGGAPLDGGSFGSVFTVYGATSSAYTFANASQQWQWGIASSISGAAGLYDATAGGYKLLANTTGSITPGTDNSQPSGSGSMRWSTVYAGTGTINTSDAREKAAVTPMTDTEIAAAKQLASEIGTYRFLDAIAAKGDAARTHVGMTVQRAIEVMESHGLDPMRYGFICHDEWAEDGEQPAGDRYAFRPDELLMFLMRGVEARLTAAGL